MNDERLQNRNDHHSTWNMSPGKKKSLVHRIGILNTLGILKL